MSSKALLRENGKVVVAYKRNMDLSRDWWHIRERAKASGLQLTSSSLFEQVHFPGYRNRYGAGNIAAQSFPTSHSVCDCWNVANKDV